ncbi:MAG: fibronectin type III domain-containing protein [Candidatus Nomurabacteria bacterium]|jgi:hypothetical protein|nr:fibronectin type III domain-containing protein [Candidatus Nomurabacteria bacterium]
MRKLVLGLILCVGAVISIIAPSVMHADNLEKLPEPVLKVNPDPVTNPDDWFFNYRLTNLAETTDDLVEKTVGSKLEIDGDSWWLYPSYNSASVGFSTSKSTITRIEYGETGYTQKTSVSESYYFNHLHYLTGLKENTTYHYRVIYQDRAGTVKATEDKVFTTKQFTSEVKLTNQDFPLQITSSGTYVLTEDITSDGLGINIKANDVIIDLNGHTLIYDNAPPTATPDPTSGWQYVEDANYGIRAGRWNFVNSSIFNGTIKQGANGETGMTPIFLFHMSGTTQNEIAGVTVDYYSDSNIGMRTGNGHIHHNVVYDRGAVIEDRHSGLRSIHAGTDSQVTYNSLRRFRHRGIDCGANCEVAMNELYSDSYDTNSFAIGSGEDHFIHDNKIFGLGYLFIGIGWGNGMTASGNLIYGRCYAPNMRSTEYARPSSVAGMRVTSYYDSDVFKDMLVENNTIVLKAEKSPVGDIGCTMARGLWVTNGTRDHESALVYRKNTIKVEAMPGNFDISKSGVYYNGDVNNALTTVTIQGTGWTSEEIADAILLEDNHLITNVNHIVLGEGYGITNGARFYGTTFEKIEHDSEFFRPVRLGFWYWNTLGNKIIDTKLVGISEKEFEPYFYGGTGKMDIKYGFSKNPQFVDQHGSAIANQTITIQIDGDETTQITTDAGGYASFEVITNKYYKYGNSVENGGISGTPAQIDYQAYQFSLANYQPNTMPISSLKSASQIVLEKVGGNDGNDDVANDDDQASDEKPKNETASTGQKAASQTSPKKFPISGTQNVKILLSSLALGFITYLSIIVFRHHK